MTSTVGARACPPCHHFLSHLQQARTHVTLPTATDVCLPFGMQSAAPHMLCTPNPGQRLLNQLEACWNGWCVRRAGSDLNPNLLLVFIAFIAVESFAVMSPTFRSALVTWQRIFGVRPETSCQRETRGTGASAQIVVSCACRGVKVLVEDHVDTLIRTTGSGQDG